MDKVLCHFYTDTYYDEWRVVITNYTDGKQPIWDNASSEGIRAYDASTSQSCYIYNSAIFAGSPEPSYHVVNVCLLANEAFTLKIQYKRSQDSEWIEGNTQNYNKLNNGFYTVSSSPITIKSAVTDLRTTTIISSGFDNSKPVTSELDIPIFSDYSAYGQFVLAPAPAPVDVDHTLTVQVLNDNIVFTMYTDNVAIYQWTSPIGSTPEDVANIYPHFLWDTNNHVAKPSFIYYNGDGTYQYNQESPTDAEMALIYEWLQAGVN